MDLTDLAKALVDGQPFSRLTSDQFCALGEIIADCALLESLVEYAIWDSIKMDAGFGACLTTHMPFSGRIQSLQSIAELACEDGKYPIYQELLDLADRIDKINRKRNEIIHNHWAPIDDSQVELETLLVKARGKLSTKQAKTDAKKLHGFRMSITQTIHDMFDVLDRLQKGETGANP